MKQLLLLLTSCVLSHISPAQLNIPAPSPQQTIHQAFGLGAIDLSYSRPGVKGRKIFGDLVPYGTVWRTGANGPTTITFTDTVSVGGVKITPAKYGLLAIPGKNQWIIIITRQLDFEGGGNYDQSADVVRFKTNPIQLSKKIENFTMQFENISNSKCELWMTWDETRVIVPVTTNVDNRIMAEIDNAIKGDKPPYFAAASYYFEEHHDLHKAKEWAQKATIDNPKAYYMFYLLARIESKLGEKAEAIATAKKSIALAEEAQRSDYKALNEKLIKSLQ